MLRMLSYSSFPFFLVWALCSITVPSMAWGWECRAGIAGVGWGAKWLYVMDSKELTMEMQLYLMGCDR